MDLNGTRVLITGGSSGIGRATAAGLIRAGCKVSINGRDPERLETAGRELDCDVIRGDVGQEAEAKSIVESFVARHGGIDVLINNAGFGTFAPLLETELADVEAVFRTNVFGAFVMAREVARHLVAQRSGTIVNIASTAATKGFSGGTAYAASKFALRGMNECWREELRRHDVRVILINPSEVITDFAKRAGYPQKANDKKLLPEDIAHAIVGALQAEPRAFTPELAVFATNPF
ncbi:MAG: SDR family oxidoreductase [Thermoanaerobaculia bacterium]